MANPYNELALFPNEITDAIRIKHGYSIFVVSVIGTVQLSKTEAIRALGFVVRDKQFEVAINDAAQYITIKGLIEGTN